MGPKKKDKGYSMLITHRLQRLGQLQQFLLGSGRLEEKLKKITEGVVEIFNADFSRIWISKPGDLCNSGCIHAKAMEAQNICQSREYCLHLVASSGRYTHTNGGHSRMPFGLYKLGRVAIGQVSEFLTNDVVSDPQIMDHNWARKIGLVSFAGYRLQDAAGKTIGVLALFSKQPITPEEDALLESLAGTAAQVIKSCKAELAIKEERARLITITDQLSAIANAMTSFLESGNWRESSSIILCCALRLTESEYGFIGIVTEGPVLRILCHEGVAWDKAINREFYEKALNTYKEVGYLEFTNLENLFGAVITTRKAVISNDPSRDPRSGNRLPPGHPPLPNFLGVPVIKEVKVVGMIGVANRPGGYSETDQSNIEILCQAAGILYDSYLRHEKEIALEKERNQAEEQIHHLSYHDLLTDLPNRLMFHICIDKAITAARCDNESFALLIINIDRFEEINDSLGHHIGDMVLRQIGFRLKDGLKQTDIVAHLSGDEYAVLLLKADGQSAIEATQCIIKRLEDPFLLEDIPISVNACIGIALFPGHGEDYHTLMKHADIAMHAAKKGDGGICLYSPRYKKYSPERLRLTGELRHGIEQNHLFLVYQPKTDLKTGKTIGVEALVRWQHPRLGAIMPDQFIKLAEHTGLIKQLTLWVIKEALRQSKCWYSMGLETGVAINLSVRSLLAPQLLDQVGGLLSTWGIEPDQLRFEITESIIMADPQLTMEIIKQLSGIGIKFSIDDFGTGYSSLSYLQRLPVDEIKIDRSFIMNMSADENSIIIVRSIIELAHSLGLRVIAEGVEDQHTLNRLASFGCDAAQGYFISRPISSTELPDWFKKGNLKIGLIN